jgi:hypothetical protein
VLDQIRPQATEDRRPRQAWFEPHVCGAYALGVSYELS